MSVKAYFLKRADRWIVEGERVTIADRHYSILHGWIVRWNPDLKTFIMLRQLSRIERLTGRVNL